ncbi:ArsR/SmtB family transcription factor [Streptomyces sp. NPDC096132]|uniref:ArsR/SmtB family transcription factor n=1 Tax=Streptomyces sp. NPDC096132 TaxID=3366075 RepID=UPI00381FFCBC
MAASAARPRPPRDDARPAHHTRLTEAPPLRDRHPLSGCPLRPRDGSPPAPSPDRALRKPVVFFLPAFAVAFPACPFLADPHRVRLCRLIARQAMTTADLADRLSMTRPDASRH